MTPASAEQLNVLLVEDSAGDAALVRSAMEEAAPDATLCWVESLAAAEVAMETGRWSCILLDLGLPDADGVEALDRTLAAASGTPIVVLTGHADERAGRAAVAAGAQDYLVKGSVSPPLLVRALAYAVERHRLGRELQLLLDSAAEGVFATDVRGVCTFANRAACDQLGYEPGDLLGRQVHDIVHACATEADECAVARAFVGEAELRVGDDWMRRADGEVFAAELSCAPVNDAGVLHGAVVSFFDITERRRVEEALRTSEARYRTIVETAEEGIWLLDVDGITTFVNQSMAEMLGYEPAEMVGTPSSDYLGDAGPHPAFSHSGERVEVRLLHRDGSELWTLFSTSPSYAESGADAGVLVMVSDITSRRLAEEGVRQLAAIVEHSNDAIFSVSLDGVVRSWNDAATRIFGWEAAEIVGRSIDAIVPPDRTHEDLFILEAARQGRSVEHFETVRRRKDGRVIDVSLTASPTRDAEGNVAAMAVIARDITERKRSVTWLAAQSKVLGMVAQGKPLGETLEAVARIVEGDSTETSCAVVLSDPVTGEVQQSAGRRAPEGAGEDEVPASWSIPVRGEADNQVLGAITVHQRDRTSPTSGELARAELAARLVAIAVERTRFEERLVHQALHDSLTSLPNRLLFMDRLGSAISRASRGGSRAAVLFLDLDRFKVVNDSLGHAAGDALLQQVVTRLQRLLRPSDTIARLGGDEFAVLCEELDDDRAVTEVADRIERALREPFTIRGAEVHVSTSIGIALALDADATPESLLRDADAAMYRAKDRGRARYELFDQTLRAQATRRLEIENALRHAIENGELRVHYQPEVDLITGGVTGVEALVRWQHPEQGLLLPGAFVPVAEETGLIVALGQWVLEEACAQRRRWTEAHPDWPPLGMSVNISARQLSRPDLPEMVAATLAFNGIPAAALCLEITETVLMEDVETVSVAFDALRRLGVRVAVDDFGTGYSSLIYLKRFPVRRLKIDRRFVAGLGHDADDAAIVAGVVSLAHALGLEAVAEGVERPEQLAALRATECDIAQGFHWSEALSPEQFEAWMRDTAASWEPGGGEVAARRLSPEQARNRALAAAAGAEASVLKAAGEARAAFAAARAPGDAVQALITFVYRLGGTVAPASARDPRAIPVDLSFGEGEPVLPVCDSFSVTRMHLIRLLPVMADEARAVIDSLRAAAV